MALNYGNPTLNYYELLSDNVVLCYHNAYGKQGQSQEIVDVIQPLTQIL